MPQDALRTRFIENDGQRGQALTTASPQAEKKASTRLTATGQVAHSFETGSRWGSWRLSSVGRRESCQQKPHQEHRRLVGEVNRRSSRLSGSCSSFTKCSTRPGAPWRGLQTSWGTAPSRLASRRYAMVVMGSPCLLGHCPWVGSLAVPQDALRTRFIENWCKVVQTGGHSKPLLRLGSPVYPPVRALR